MADLEKQAQEMAEKALEGSKGVGPTCFRFRGLGVWVRGSKSFQARCFRLCLFLEQSYHFQFPFSGYVVSLTIAQFSSRVIVIPDTIVRASRREA